MHAEQLGYGKVMRHALSFSPVTSSQCTVANIESNFVYLVSDESLFAVAIIMVTFQEWTP